MNLTEAVNKVTEHIGLPLLTVQLPTLVVISGLPGTGKSYFSRHLAERMEAVVVPTDLIRQTLFTPPSYSAKESFIVYRVGHMLIKRLLAQGYRVIFDATNLQESGRTKLYRIAEEAGAKLIIVRMVAPEHVVHQRLQQRAICPNPADLSEANWDVYLYMKPTEQRIKRRHYVVDSSRDTEPVLDKIAAESQT